VYHFASERWFFEPVVLTYTALYLSCPFCVASSDNPALAFLLRAIYIPLPAIAAAAKRPYLHLEIPGRLAISQPFVLFRLLSVPLASSLLVPSRKIPVDPFPRATGIELE
jgi:hypothetical protein